MKVAIVIPAFNEAGTIARVVNDVAPYGHPIVVDDCSTDNTAELARAAGAEVVSHQVNSGYDAALQSGFENADKPDMEAVVTFDADGQHDPETLKTVLLLLDKENNDLVLGVRSNSARVSEFLFSAYTNWRYGVSDILCGLKGYRISVYRAYGKFDGTRSIGTELALYGLRSKMKYSTVRVPIALREEGAARFGNSLRANGRILRAMVMAIIQDLQSFFPSGSRQRKKPQSGDRLL